MTSMQTILLVLQGGVHFDTAALVTWRQRRTIEATGCEACAQSSLLAV